MIQTIGQYVAGIWGLLFIVGLGFSFLAFCFYLACALFEKRKPGLDEHRRVSMAPQKEDGALTGHVS